MNKNSGFVPKELKKDFMKTNEENYVDILYQQRVYYYASTDEGQIKVPKALIFEAFFDMSNRQYHSELID